MKTESRKLLSDRGISAKMAANGTKTHARTNQRRAQASRSRQSLKDGLDRSTTAVLC